MDKHEAKPLWKCGECGEIHDDEDGARECCMPRVYEMYGCPVCDSVHDDEDAALKCCGPQGIIRCQSCARDYSQAAINHWAVVVAGHCSTCNPFFSVAEQFSIEDLYLERSPYGDQSLLR